MKFNEYLNEAAEDHGWHQMMLDNNFKHEKSVSTKHIYVKGPHKVIIYQETNPKAITEHNKGVNRWVHKKGDEVHGKSPDTRHNPYKSLVNHIKDFVK